MKPNNQSVTRLFVCEVPLRVNVVVKPWIMNICYSELDFTIRIALV